MRRPKGIKTRKAVAKRFKNNRTRQSHAQRAPASGTCCKPKTPSAAGASGTAKQVDPTDAYRILQNLPFSH
jgi:ribosomal protein L35